MCSHASAFVAYTDTVHCAENALQAIKCESFSSANNAALSHTKHVCKTETSCRFRCFYSSGWKFTMQYWMFCEPAGFPEPASQNVQHVCSAPSSNKIWMRGALRHRHCHKAYCTKCWWQRSRCPSTNQQEFACRWMPLLSALSTKQIMGLIGSAEEWDHIVKIFVQLMNVPAKMKMEGSMLVKSKHFFTKQGTEGLQRWELSSFAGIVGIRQNQGSHGSQRCSRQSSSKQAPVVSNRTKQRRDRLEEWSIWTIYLSTSLFCKNKYYD